MTQRIVLSGYYGFNNAGDDAVCYAICQALQEEIPDCELTILSHQPAASEAYYGHRAKNRWQPSQFVPEIAFSDLLISGGGSLLQDSTSRNGILYYLGILQAAHLLGIPQMIYAQGLGPVNHRRNQVLVAKVLNHADLITVRDSASRRLLHDLGVNRQIRLTPDPVLGLRPESAEVAERLLRQNGRREKGPLLLCAPRLWGQEDRVLLYVEALDRLAQEGYDIALLAMQPSAEADLCQAIAGHMKARAVLLTESYDMPTLLSLFAASDLVIAMRLHALIMGALSGSALVAISYDPKVEAFMRLIDCPQQCLPLLGLTANQVVSQALQAKAADENRVRLLGELSRLPAKYAKTLLA